MVDRTRRRKVQLMAMAFAVMGCQAPLSGSKEGGAQAVQYATDVVKRQDLIGYSFFDGKLVVPDSARATIFSPYDAPVLEVMTGMGKQVRRGTPIIKLTIVGAESATASAKAGVNAANAEYSSQKGASSDPVRDAKAALSEARAAERAARDTIANGGEADLAMATQIREASEQALIQAQDELKQSLQPTKAGVEMAAASLRDAKADEAKGILRAPISGTVVAMAAQAGLSAKAKQELATIISFSSVRVQAMVPAELKDLVVRNSRVTIAFDGPSADPLDGRVTDVSVAPPRAGQKSAGYLAVIRFVSPQAYVQSTAAVKRVGVRSGSVKGALVVPVGAIRVSGSDTTVQTLVAEKWVETAVVTGLSDGALVEIKSGIKEGDTVHVLLSTVTKPKG